MDERVQFLRDRLDEDQAAASRAGDSFRQIGETGVIVATDGDRAEECASANWAGIAEHIVRHDPARVLAEVESKRQNLAELKAAEEAMDRAARDRDTVGYNAVRAEWTVLKRVVLRDLSVYADHPAYKPEWRP